MFFRATDLAFAFAPALALVLLTGQGMAAGEEDTPPVRTQTSEQCTGAQVFDPKTKTCVDAQDSRLDDASRIDAARELVAYGRARDALAVLSAVTRAPDAELLTLRGFATRKAGDFVGGKALYDAALTLDPDYWLARSYLGQALAERGETDAARTQLALIREGGGRGTWAERALAEAIRTGRGYSF